MLLIAVAIDAPPGLTRPLGALELILAGAFTAAALLDRAPRCSDRTGHGYLAMIGVVVILPLSYGVLVLAGVDQLSGPVAGLQLLGGVVLFAVSWTMLGPAAVDILGARVALLDAAVAFFSALALLSLATGDPTGLSGLSTGHRATLVAQSFAFGVLAWILGRSRERGPVPWKQLVLWVTAAAMFVVAGIPAAVSGPSTFDVMSMIVMSLALVVAGLAALRPEGEVESARDVRIRETVSRLSSTVGPSLLFLVLLAHIWRDVDVPREASLLAMCALAGVLIALGVIRRANVDKARELMNQRGVAAMHESELHPWLETLVSNADDIVTVVDQHGEVIYQTASGARLLGYTPGGWVGRNVRSLVPESLAGQLDAALTRAAARESGRSSVCLPLIRADGQQVPADFVVAAIASRGRATGGFVITSRMIPDTHVPRSELELATTTDALTRRPNLLGLRQQAELAVQVHGRDRVGVLAVDIAGFTELNDRLGHDLGDDLLIRVGHAIDRCVRPWDVVARLGGDEFAVLVVGANAERAIVRIHERVRRVLESGFVTGAAVSRLFVEAGYAIVSDDDMSAAKLLRNADLALARARATNTPQLQAYEESMHTELVARAETEAAIRLAFARNEFELYFQPVVDLSSAAVVGVEALLRWHHPTEGLLAPAQFLREVGELGLGGQLCTWVVGAAADAAATLCAIDSDKNRMAVGFNVGARDLRPGLVRELQASARRTGIDPSCLVVEVTEESLISTPAARLTIADLRAIGVKVAIDDFGVGYSSLSYLEAIPVDFVKVDRSFITGITTGSTKAALVGAILGLADALRLDAVVEGLETAQEVEVVRRLGARLVQGWHFAPALPLEEVVQMLRRGPAFSETSHSVPPVKNTASA